MKILPLVFPVLLCLSGSFANARSLPFAQPKLVKVPGTKVSLVPLPTPHSPLPFYPSSNHGKTSINCRSGFAAISFFDRIGEWISSSGQLIFRSGSFHCRLISPSGS